MIITEIRYRNRCGFVMAINYYLNKKFYGVLVNYQISHKSNQGVSFRFFSQIIILYDYIIDFLILYIKSIKTIAFKITTKISWPPNPLTGQSNSFRPSNSGYPESRTNVRLKTFKILSLRYFYRRQNVSTLNL